MTEFLSGDVLTRTWPNGRTDYIRIGGPNPDGSPSIWVMTCNSAGRLTVNSGRYLLATTIATRYRAHSRPQEVYSR